MKKALKFVLVCMLAMNMFACSAKKPTGTYADGIGIWTLSFIGNNIEMKTSSSTVKGTFTMAGDNIVVSWETGGSDTFTYDSSKDVVSFQGVLDFVK